MPPEQHTHSCKTAVSSATAITCIGTIIIIIFNTAIVALITPAVSSPTILYPLFVPPWLLIEVQERWLRFLQNGVIQFI